MATIDTYFMPKESDLPSANGAISKIIPSSSIKIANQMVSKSLKMKLREVDRNLACPWIIWRFYFRRKVRQGLLSVQWSVESLVRLGSYQKNSWIVC